MKRIAFTLGEVLIALAVVGVISELVLPQLITNHKAAQARAQFDTAYSMIAKSIADMDADNVSLDPASYNNSQSFYPVYKQYHNIATDCGDFNSASKNSSVCIAKSAQNNNANNDMYYIFKKNSQTQVNIDYLDDGAFVLNNGMLFAIDNPTNGHKWISVDINGKNKFPNRWGWDLFTFELVKGDILPVGAPGTSYSAEPEKYCDKTSNEDLNGITCGYFAVTNQDYFKNLYAGKN